jgi:hypothetical protein
MNKNDIATSNLTVHDNALFDFNKVSYKTSNIYNSDLQQYPPVDLSDSTTHTRLEDIDYTQFIIRLSNDDMYILKSNYDLFPDDSEYDGSKIINIFNTVDKYWIPHAIDGISSQEARLYSTAIGNNVYTSSFQSPVGSSTGNWLYIELPREIVLTKISFKTHAFPVHQFTIFGKNDVEYINILTKTLPDHFQDVEVEISDNSAVYSKYLIVFNSLFDNSIFNPNHPNLQINSFNLFGHTRTNIISLKNILQNKQDQLITNYGLEIVDNKLQFNTVFMQMIFFKYNTNYDFTLNRLPYKFIGVAGSAVEPRKRRIFDVSIVDNVNENLIYSYVVNVGTPDQVAGYYTIEYVPVFSYFSTSTVTKINHSIQFGDWATIRLQRTAENDDHKCSVEIHKNCTVNIVSR